jgi:hypothetical protein
VVGICGRRLARFPKESRCLARPSHGVDIIHLIALIDVTLWRSAPPIGLRLCGFSCLALGSGCSICTKLGAAAYEFQLPPKLATKSSGEGWYFRILLESVLMRTDPLYKFPASGYVRFAPAEKKSQRTI